MKLLRVAVLTISLMLTTMGLAASGAEDSKTKAVIIDVRTAPEFQEGHLEGALNIPYDKIAESIEKAVPDKKSKVILYCRTGRRSSIALDTLTKVGYEDVTNLMTVKEASEKLKKPLIKGIK